MISVAFCLVISILRSNGGELVQDAVEARLPAMALRDVKGRGV